MLRIARIELAGFKSFRDASSITLGSDFSVAVGKNGAWKSTIVDAFQFVLGCARPGSTADLINQELREGDGVRAEARVCLHFACGTTIERVVTGAKKSSYRFNGKLAKRGTVAQWLKERGLDAANPSRYVVAQSRASVAGGRSLLHLVESVVGTLPLAARIATLAKRVDGELAPQLQAAREAIARDERERAATAEAVADLQAFRASCAERAATASALAVHRASAARHAHAFWTKRHARAAANRLAAATALAAAQALRATSAAAAAQRDAAAVDAKALWTKLKARGRRTVAKLGKAEAKRDELDAERVRMDSKWSNAVAREHVAAKASAAAQAHFAAAQASVSASAADAASSAAALAAMESVSAPTKRRVSANVAGAVAAAATRDGAALLALTVEIDRRAAARLRCEAAARRASELRRAVDAEAARAAALAARLAQRLASDALCARRDHAAVQQKDALRTHATARRMARAAQRAIDDVRCRLDVFDDTCSSAAATGAAAARRAGGRAGQRNGGQRSGAVALLQKRLGGDAVVGTLGELCTVDSGHKTALLRVLGGALARTIVVRDRSAAIAVAEHFRTERVGAVRCLILNELRGGRGGAEGGGAAGHGGARLPPLEALTFRGSGSGSSASGPLALQPLCSALRIAPRAVPAFRHLLKSYYVAPTRALAVECCEAMAAQSANHARSNIVTLRGEIFKSNGEISGGMRSVSPALRSLLVVHDAVPPVGAHAARGVAPEAGGGAAAARTATARSAEGSALRTALARALTKQQRDEAVLKRALRRSSSLTAEVEAFDAQMHAVSVSGGSGGDGGSINAAELRSRLARSEAKLSVLRTRARGVSSSASEDASSTTLLKDLERRRAELVARIAAADPLIALRTTHADAQAAVRAAASSAEALRTAVRVAAKRARSATRAVESLARGLATTSVQFPAATAAVATLQRTLREHSQAQQSAAGAAKASSARMRAARKTLEASDAEVVAAAAARRTVASATARLGSRVSKGAAALVACENDVQGAMKQWEIAAAWQDEERARQLAAAAESTIASSADHARGEAVAEARGAESSSSSSLDDDDDFEDDPSQSAAAAPEIAAATAAPPPLGSASLLRAISAMGAAVDALDDGANATTMSSSGGAIREKAWTAEFAALSATLAREIASLVDATAALNAHVELHASEVDNTALERDDALVARLRTSRAARARIDGQLRACTVEHELAVRDRFARVVAGAKKVNMQLGRIYGAFTRVGDAHLGVPSERSVAFREGLNLTVKPDATPWRAFRLLSGGQQALGALALTLALHACFPCPIFVLDEIDAALDAKKVEAVARVLAESARTSGSQYLVVSHRRAMQRAASQICAVYRCGGTSRSASIELRPSTAPRTTIMESE